MANPSLHVPSEVYGSSMCLARTVDAVVLGAGTEESYTVPSAANFAIITADGAFYARVGATAAIPVGEVTDGTASQYFGAGVQIRVEGGSVIHFIRAGSTQVIITIGLYK